MRKKKLSQISITVILILLLIILGWTLIRSSSYFSDEAAQKQVSHDH